MSEAINSFDHKIHRISASFQNPEEEKQYRFENHSETARQLRIALLPMAVINLLWLYIDYLALELTPAYYSLAFGRALLILVIFAVIFATFKKLSTNQIDSCGVIYLIMQAVVGCSGMILKQESAALYGMVGVFLILFIYFIIPNRFLWTVFSALPVSGIFIASVSVASNPTHRELVSVIIVLAFCNVGGAAAAYQSHRLQRLRFASSQDEKLAREALEAEIAAKDQAVKAKNHFIAAASHDLRQPAQSLMLYSTLLQQQDLGKTPNQAVAGIVQSTKALQQLLNSLLDISRLEAELIKPEVKAFNLQQVFENLATEIAPHANEKGLYFKADICESMMVETDPVLLERILRNLLLNAVKYTDTGGLSITCKPLSNSIRIEVCDTGGGIPEDKREKVFDDFFQVDNSDQEEIMGLGIGLSTVRRMTDLLDLPLELQSEMGTGSVFSVEVPISTAQSNNAVKHIPQPTGYTENGLSILVIDDDESILQSFKALGEDWGHRVVVATSKEAATKVLDGKGFDNPDLIIADYRLQNGETGIQAIAALKERLGEDVRAAIMTGDTASSLLKRITESGMTVLHKPIDPKQLSAFLAAE